MSRLVIIGGLATILVSLVALVTLVGVSNQSATEEALQDPETQESTPDPNPEANPEADPEADPDSVTAPTADPDADPAETPTTTPEEPSEAPLGQDEEQGRQNAQESQEEPPVQGIQPGGQAEDSRNNRQAPATGPVAGPRVATIEISGDARYSCSIGLIDSPRTILGVNPASFQVRVTPGGTALDTVMAVCQKARGEELGVGIIYDGEVKAQDDTTGRFGTVSVSWSPVQE